MTPCRRGSERGGQRCGEGRPEKGDGQNVMGREHDRFWRRDHDVRGDYRVRAVTMVVARRKGKPGQRRIDTGRAKVRTIAMAMKYGFYRHMSVRPLTEHPTQAAYRTETQQAYK